MLHPTRTIAVLLAIGVPAVSAQTVIDINQTGEANSSTPLNATPAAAGQKHDSLLAFNGGWIFSAEHPTLGREPHFSDGTAAGTYLLADVMTGTADSDPAEFAVIGGVAVFRAEGADTGAELWVTDGTPAGTQLLGDIYPGSNSSNPTGFAELGGKLYFAATEPAAGTELWVTDGTAAGTMLAVDIVPGPGTSLPTELTLDANGTELFFSAADPSVGREPYRTDGTPAGTNLIANISPFGSSDPRDFFVWNGSTYFSANGELWAVNGLLGNTVQITPAAGAPTVPNPRLRYATEFAGRLYFTSLPGDGLWSTDGVTYDQVIGGASPAVNPVAHTVFGGKLYFLGHDAAFGRTLWSYDGTTAAPVLDLDPTTLSDTWPSEAALFQAHGRMWFSGSTAGGGFKLWASDGTAAGTSSVDAVPDPDTGGVYALTDFGAGQVMFVANDPATGRELWVSDGVSAQLLVDVAPGSNTENGASSGWNDAATNGRELYFGGNDGVHQSALFRWDATNGVMLIKDISPGGPGNFTAFTPVWVDDRMLTFFFANDGVHGIEPWVTDGTEAGTQMVADLWSAGWGALGHQFFSLNGRAVFAGRTNTGERGVYVSDGTEAGTELLTTFTEAGIPGEFVQLGDVLLFRGSDPSTGNELWRTDGTVAGTYMVKDIDPGSFGSNPTSLTRFGEYAVFAANDGNGPEPWYSDGTAAGTQMIADLYSGHSPDVPKEFTEHRSKLYFAAPSNATGQELWRLDSIGSAPVLVADILPGANGSNPGDLTSSGDGLYLRANIGSTGAEILRYDDVTGTGQLIVDLVPGVTSSGPVGFEAVGDGVFFVADVPGFGRELYYADATGHGMVADMMPGPEDGNIFNPILVDGHVVFTSDTPDKGRELVILPVSGATARDLFGGTGGIQLQATPPQLGGPLTLRVDGIPATSAVTVLAYAPLAPPSSEALLVPGAASWLPLANAQIAAYLFAKPHAEFTQMLPNDPSLLGLAVAAQCWVLPATGFPATSSNGVALTLGN